MAAISPACGRYQRAHAGIGWVPQERNIVKSLTVEENLTPSRGRAPGPSRESTTCFPG